MNNKPIIILFEENEMNIATLYSLYAQNIEGKQKFWNKLSDEEIRHAAEIGTSKDAENAIMENKFSRIIIRNVIDFVLEEISRAQHGSLSHHEALKTALRIEQSMLEKKCFDIFSPNDKKVQDVFCKLNKETEQHVKRLLQEMKKNKFTF